MAMVSVNLRYSGEGCWRPMTLPVSLSVAHTLTAAARTLGMADEVKVNGAQPVRPAIDIKV